MRPQRPLAALSFSLAALVAVLAFACGGGGGEDEVTSNPNAVPTATLPNPLPEPRILGGSDLPVQGDSYTVERGDNLDSIARRFGTTVDALVEANNIDDPTSLFVGQVLTIPGLQATPDQDVAGATVEPSDTPEPSEETIYRVQSGDVAALIAERFGITTAELAEANNTTIDDLRTLSVGDELIIPAPAPSETPEP
ncbi:MAG: LysM peptidoglycan-binding domain-containing protein [Dehalococcoidia bacterium]